MPASQGGTGDLNRWRSVVVPLVTLNTPRSFERLPAADER